MKKKFLLFALITSIAVLGLTSCNKPQVALNAENFPDANFRAALAEILEISEGDEITEEKIAATTSLDVSGEEIADLTGIEHFTALTSLFCNFNQLTALDVSQNTALTTLGCGNNQLTSLDLSQNTALIWLYCNNNQIKGEAMDALVNSLQTVNWGGVFFGIDTKDENEGNVCTEAQVAVAKRKGWTVYDNNVEI